MKLLFIDFETQCDDAPNTNITEVGASLYEIATSTDPFSIHTKVWGMSQLVYNPSYPPQTPEIVELTGITDEMLKKDGAPLGDALDPLFPIINASDFVLAHNRKFDQTVYESGCKRVNPSYVPAKPKEGWICTYEDVPWPKKYKCKKLSHLAFDHGIQGDITKLHRAEYDTDLLAKLILTKYRIEDIIAYWRQPWVYLRAVVLGPWVGDGGDGGVGVAQAKKLGFRWQDSGDGKIFEKKWVKRCKESEIPGIKAAAPFGLKRLTENT